MNNIVLTTSGIRTDRFKNEFYKIAAYKKGKNYYAEIDNIRITINSNNYCVITAHIMNDKKVRLWEK